MAGRDQALRQRRSAARPPHCSRGGVEGEFGGVRARASSTPSTPWRSILGGSPGCFRVVSGGSAPDTGLSEHYQGMSGHFHTSCIDRALLPAQDRRWIGSTVIFVIALVDFNTPDW